MKIYPYYSSHDSLTCYLIGNEICKEALIIDPGKITEELINQIEHNGYTLTGACITHNSAPYYGHGLETLLKIYDLAVYAADSDLVPQCGTVLNGDCRFLIAGFSVECLSFPGYFPDAYVFKIVDCMFTGGSLITGGIGDMLHSSLTKTFTVQLEKKLCIYDDSILLFPGYGPPSTLGAERRLTYTV